MAKCDRSQHAQGRSGRRRAVAVTAGGAALLVAAAGCGGSAAKGGSAASTKGRSAQLTVQFAGPPISLNPALGGNGGSAIFTGLDYDSLTYLSGSGKLVPDLATSWKYVGTGNKTFEMTLRKGVKFTDGSVMTAADVVKSMQYFLKAGGGLVGGVGSVSAITAPSTDTVEVTYKTANPDAAMTMDQYAGIGEIIGPKGLADPNSLLTKSDGTGQYTYDSATSVTDSIYSYTRNPAYFNPAAQKYNKISVKIIGDPNAVASAVETNQVAFASGSSATAPSVKQAGVNIVTAPFFNWSMILPDTGSVVPAMANEKVRQAIAYAFNRPALANALGGTYATASKEVLLPGTNGYVPGSGYTYDLAKAKQLMAQAGYPNGFSMTVLTESLIDPNTTFSQAFASSLSAIGIKAKLQVISTGIGQFSSAAQSKKYAAVIFPSAGVDMFQLAQQILPPGIFNPFALATPANVQSLLSQGYASSGAAQTKLYQQADQMLDQMATVVPIIATKTPTYVSSQLANVTESVVNPNPMPEAPVASLAWYQK